jgi:hypothetical protein
MHRPIIALDDLKLLFVEIKHEQLLQHFADLDTYRDDFRS